MRLLLVEDDELLADGLARALRRAGYVVDVAQDGNTVLTALCAHEFDVILLDLGLPDMDGSIVLQHIRQARRKTPVLVISARPAIEERVRLLDLGADDYLVKPVAIDELSARLRVLIRRSHGEADSCLHLGRLTIDLNGRTASLDGQLLDLTARDWSLIAYLATRPRRAVDKEQLAQALYDWDSDITPNAIEKSVSRLRAKLAPAGITIRTVRGLGYFLETDDVPPG